MFGYIIVNKPELKFKEFDVYRSFYCGLCKSLKSRGGNISRLSLSYDMTFIYILLTGLYEPKTICKKEKCIFHPIHKTLISENGIGEYVADMSVVMTYYKCRDDWNDDKKLTSKFMMKMLRKKHKNITDKYYDKIKNIAELMEKLDNGEQEKNYNIDYMAGLFGKIMGELFSYKQDEWETYLGRMGFYLGKFIYLLDAYEDIKSDIKTNNYNPFWEIYKQDDFEKKARDILVMMMAECSREFEKLPIIENAELLRNILYSGVGVRYENIRKERCTAVSGPGRKNDKSV